MNTTLTLGEAILIARRRKGYSQEELSLYSGVCVQTIRDLERGTNEYGPKLTTIQRLDTALDGELGRLQ